MTYRTPGVYVGEAGTPAPVIAPVTSAEPVFIGCTEDSTLKNEPIRIASLQEFETLFGRAPPSLIDLQITRHFSATGTLLGIDVALDANRRDAAHRDVVPTELMHYSLQHYFANGGGPCRVYSLGEYGSHSKRAYIEALAALENADTPMLLVFPDATRLPAGEHEEVVRAALASCLRSRNSFTIADVADAIPGGANDTAAHVTDGFRTNLTASPANALQYGAAYWPYLRTRIPCFTDDDRVRITRYDETYAGREGPGRPVAVSSPWPGLARGIVSRLKSGGRAPNVTSSAPSTGRARSVMSPLEAAVDRGAVALSSAVVRRDAAVDRAARSFVEQLCVTLPPSAAVAGAYVTADRDRGVFKAPANCELALVAAPALDATAETLDALNVDQVSGKSVNVIRHIAGRGTVVWGARTLAGNDHEFRYVPVRRVVTMIEASLQQALAGFAAERNDAATWARVRAAFEGFLLSQWRAGALQGMKPAQAFFVRVGLLATMTAQDIERGRLIVVVGVAPLRAAEFIVLHLEQRVQRG